MADMFLIFADMISGALVLGSWGNTMRGAVRNKERWKARPAPTQDPSTNNTAREQGDPPPLLAPHAHECVLQRSVGSHWVMHLPAVRGVIAQPSIAHSAGSADPQCGPHCGVAERYGGFC